MEPVQPKPSEVPPSHIRVFTWNVLMSYYAKSSYHPYAKAEWLAREYRDSLAKQQIVNSQAGLICLQQVDYDSPLLKVLKQLGYDYQTRMIGEQGVLIAYRKDLFDKDKHWTMNYDDSVPKEFSGKVYKTGHGMIVLQLTHRPTGRRLLVCTTHIFWNPAFEKVKYHQACTMLDQIAKLKTPDMAVVIAADLNSGRHSNVLQVLLHGSKPIKDKCQFQNANYEEMSVRYKQCSGLPETYTSALDGGPACTNHTNKFKGTLDYILYSKELKAGKRDWQQKGEEELIPDKTHSSDHIWLMCDFEFVDIK